MPYALKLLNKFLFFPKMSPKKRDESEEEEVDPLLPIKPELEDEEGVEEKDPEDEDDGIPEGDAYFFGDAADAI